MWVKGTWDVEGVGNISRYGHGGERCWLVGDVSVGQDWTVCSQRSKVGL